MSVQTNQPIKGKSQHDVWRRLYIRILTDGITPDVEMTDEQRSLELGVIEDLINAGYMVGEIVPDGSGIPVGASTRGPTLAGRLFAEEQQDILDKKMLCRNHLISGASVMG